MSTALALSERHLSLPESCLFSPTELSIPSGISKEDFSRLGRALAAIDQADGLWKADYALAAIEHFEKEEGLPIASAATGLSEFFLYKASFVAKKFPPRKRFSTFTFSHYRALLPFPDEFLDRFLPTICDQKLSAKSLRALAVAAFGKEPVDAKQPTKHSVSIREITWNALKQVAPSRKVADLIEHILLEWLARPQDERRAAINATARGREQKRKKEKIKEPADVQYQLKKFQKEHPEAVAQFSDEPVGSRENDGNKPDAAQPRPNYAERREQQIAEGAQSIPKKYHTPATIKLQWTECSGNSFLDTEEGAALLKKSQTIPTRFRSEADAIAAEQENFERCGYHEKVVHCSSCSTKVRHQIWHVAHIFSGDHLRPVV